MRFVGVPRPGDLEALDVVDRTVREAQQGEVRIRVRAASVNPADIEIRRKGYGHLEAPWIPGMDAAGIVESVGSGVERLAEGDEVMASVWPVRVEGGAQSELIVVPAASVVAIPDGASLEQAATLPMNGLTALRGLQLLNLSVGQVLLVTGSAGHLGSLVIPLAKAANLTVIADASPADDKLVRSFGADHVVPRGDKFVDAVLSLVPSGADGVFDTASLTSAVTPAIRVDGAIAVVRGWKKGAEPGRGIRVEDVQVRDVMERTDWLNKLRIEASAGRIQLRVAGTYPSEDAAEAYELMGAGGLRGRVVIVF